MLERFDFQTFVDAHDYAFDEYIGSVIAKIAKDNPKYQEVRKQIEKYYEKYPNLLKVLDSDEPCELNEDECKALIDVLQLRNEHYVMETEAIYFRGCHDGIGYLKKAGVI